MVAMLAACTPTGPPVEPAPASRVDLGDDCDIHGPSRGMVAPEPLPEGVVLASVTRCLIQPVETAGPYSRLTRVRQRAVAGLEALAEALRLPSLPRPMVCPQTGSADVSGGVVTLTDLQGRHYMPALPSEGCSDIRSEVVATINALPWQFVSTDTVDLAPTKLQMDSNCAGMYDAAIADGFVTAGGPVVSPLVVKIDSTQRPLQVCRYNLDTDPMNAIQLRGATVVRFGRLAATSTLDGDLAVEFWSAVAAAEPVTKPCTAQAPFAVVFPTPEGTTVQIELGGCYREFIEGETFLRQLDAATVHTLVRV
jgi:hypothetical protein